MPRIGGGGGGGPIIPPPPSGAQGPQGPQGPQKPDFGSKVGSAATHGTDAARTQQAKQAREGRLTGKAREIARRLQAGELDRTEATREFVGLVIEERFPKLKKRNKKGGRGEEEASPEEQIEEAVTELIAQDPVLAKRLRAQLEKLARKG